MAEVRDGWDSRLRRAVAIKLLYPGADVRPESRPRFEAEARASAQLVGRHVVVVHDVGEHNGMPFIVMERLPGVSLADHIARGPLPPVPPPGPPGHPGGPGGKHKGGGGDQGGD